MKVTQELAFGRKYIDSCSKLRWDKYLIETLANSTDALNLVIWNGKILLNHVKDKTNISKRLLLSYSYLSSIPPSHSYSLFFFSIF